jgi:hypothetical protein
MTRVTRMPRVMQAPVVQAMAQVMGVLGAMAAASEVLKRPRPSSTLRSGLVAYGSHQRTGGIDGVEQVGLQWLRLIADGRSDHFGRQRRPGQSPRGQPCHHKETRQPGYTAALIPGRRCRTGIG